MPDYIYETEEEAKKAVEQVYAEGPYEFCPIIRAKCISKCICAVPPYHRGNGAFSSEDLKWGVIGWGCNCYSLMGPP